MQESLIFYISIFLASAVLMRIGQKRKNRLFLLISLLIPILASGLRYNVGTDFKNYENIYNGIVPNLDLKGYMTYGPTELGIYFVSNIGLALNLDSWFMFTVFSALTILPIYYGIKNFNLKHPSTAYLLYLLVIFPVSFNAVRQLAAMSMVFLSVSLLYKRKNIAAIVPFIVATLMHKSSLILAIFLPIILLFIHKTTFKFREIFSMFVIGVVVLLSGSVVFSTFMQSSILSDYSQYASTSNAAAGSILILKIVIFSVFLAFTIMGKLQKLEYSRLFVVMSFLEIAMLVIGLSSVDISRFAMYFSVFSLLLIPSVTESFTRQAQRPILLLVLLYGLAMFFIQYFILKGSDIFPYQSIFGGF
jgi:membrane protein